MSAPTRVPRFQRFRPLRHAAGVLLLVAAPAGAQPVRALLTPVAGIPASAPVLPRPLTAEDVSAGTLRVSGVRFDRAFYDEIRRGFTGGLEAPARTVSVSPFPDVTFHLVLRRSAFVPASTDGRAVLAGEAQQVGGAGARGSFAMVLYGDALTLSIFSPAGNYHVHYGLDGRLEAYQEDPSAPVPCGNLRRAAGAAGAAGAAAAPARAAAAPSTSDAPSDVTVLVLHTDAAVSALGGDEDGLQAEVAKGVDLANAAFAGSGVRITARVAGGGSVRVPDSFRPSGRFAEDLDALQRNADVAALRRRLGADVVTLVRGRGDAWTIAGGAGAGADSARATFGVVYARKLADGLAFAHTLGHTLGAGHDLDAADAGDPTSDAHGWHGGIGVDARRAAHVGTIMAHVGQRIPYFSTPRVRYEGVPIGSEREDNARALNRTRSTVAAHGP
jgi:hypothetical protein